MQNLLLGLLAVVAWATIVTQGYIIKERPEVVIHEIKPCHKKYKIVVKNIKYREEGIAIGLENDGTLFNFLNIGEVHMTIGLAGVIEAPGIDLHNLAIYEGASNDD